MKRILLIVIIIATFLLDYAALDDITTDKVATTFYLEYATLIVSVPIYAFSVYLLRGNSSRKRSKEASQ